MKFNFKKIATVLGSALMVGSTIGMAAAANYPTPFTQDTAIVYGANAALSDVVAASNIGANLASAMAGSAGTTTTATTVSGEAVTLDSGSTKIWLNTSLNTAKTTLTKTDLPSVLGEYTFSGNVDSKLTSTISVGSNKVTFAKQPSSNDDPVVGVTLNSSSTAPLYNVSISMPAINFTHTDSEGESIKLFGKDYVVSTATDTTSLVLFSSAQELTLTAGGSSPVTSKEITIGNNTYTIELVTGSGTTSATVAVNGESKQITAGQSKKIGGIDVALKSVTESTALNTVTATVLVGSQKLTFTDGTAVLVGSNDDPIDGTRVTFNSGTNPGNLSGLNIAVYAPDSSSDAILAGTPFVDPVFGSFKVDFSGLNVPLDSTARDTIKVDKSGDKAMSLTLTDSEGNTKTFDFVYNNSGTTVLRDTNSYNITLVEGATLSENEYTVVGNEDYGHLIQVTRIYNFTGSDFAKDAVTFKDVISGDTYSMDATAEGSGRVTIDGRQYTVTYSGSGDSGTLTMKYPTSDSSSTEYVVFPTIKTKNGALVSLYEPQALVLSGASKSYKFPDGDGYTTVTFTNNDSAGFWNVAGATTTAATLNTTAAGATNITIGQLTYKFLSAATANATTLYLNNPQTGAAITGTGIAVFEGKDTSSNYEAVVVQLETAAAGTSSDPLGVSDISFTSPTLYDAIALQSDSDIVQSLDWWGTLATLDSNTASQAVATISYPKEQVYANVFVGAADAVISGGSTTTGAALGFVTVSDAEVSTVQGKNLLVVGGSCINTVAAKLLGSTTPLCGADFTTKTTVGSGQALIQVFANPYTTGKVAMLVAGYEAADTTKAATYLTTKPVSSDVGTKLKVTSTTEATTITA